MRTMKYLVSEYGYPYLFPSGETHYDVAMALKIKPVRGGFVTFVDGKFKCYGEAFSLKLHSNPEQDELLINRHLNTDQE